MQRPEADTVHLAMGNLSRHSRRSPAGAFGEELGGQIWNSFTAHFTPTHGSWHNQTEIEISMFAAMHGQRENLEGLRRESRRQSLPHPNHLEILSARRCAASYSDI